MDYVIPEIEKDLFDEQGCTIVWGSNIYYCYVFLIYGSLKQYEMSFFIPSNFGLKSTLSEMRMDTPAFLLSPCAWYVLPHPFTFSLWVSFSMR